MERRELFSFLSSSIKDGGTIEKEIILKPPYYADINAFDSECKSCDALCATSCQEQIIIIGEDKIPFLDLSNGGCTYCDECATACVPNVLNIKNKKPLDVTVSISEKSCLSWEGVMCFSCKDPCLEDAIEFKAMFMPTIDEDKCTACGFCISRCPAFAIDMAKKEIKVES